jgi:biotin transport system substrate-specific component
MTSLARAGGSLLDWSVDGSTSARGLRVLAVAGGVVLTAAAAQFTVPLPFTTVPFVLTPLAVLLCGAALGSRLGALTQVLYLMLGVTGVAVFAPSVTLPPGALRLAGPTGGFLIAYPVAAFVAGWLAERGWDRRYLTSVAAMTAGLALIFAGGAAWFAIVSGQPIARVLSLAVLPFLPFDLAKVAVAALILPQTWRLIGRGSARTDTAGSPRS